MNTLEKVVDAGVRTFMCTTHERMTSVCRLIQSHPELSHKLIIYPCMPYAHKYANAVTELGMTGALKSFIPDQLIMGLWKGGKAFIRKDYITLMEMLIDAEMAPFRELKTPIIFLQNAITDLLMGLGMDQIFLYFRDYVEEKYQARAGLITMNFPKLNQTLKKLDWKHSVICTSFNQASYRMSGGIEQYEHTLEITNAEIIAMQVMAAGVIGPSEALKYVCSKDKITSILFGASDERHIRQTISMIHELDQQREKMSMIF